MDVAADLDRDASYAFGNRVSTTGDTSTAWAANYFSIPPLTSNSGVTATTTYPYDNNGNVIEVGTTTFYTYDFDNRLTQSSIWGSFEQFVGRNDRTPLPSAVLRKVQMDI